MDYQEAIKAIKSNYPPSNYTILREALNIAIKTLEKQIPKAVQTINDNESYFVCSCGFTVGYFEDFREHKYCLNCGQKIDWEE